MIAWTAAIAAALASAPEAPPPSESPPATAAAPASGADQPLPGNAMLIAAGATAGAGLVANAFRIYTVTIPCQTDSQNRCSGPWVVESMFAWGFNQTSIVLAAVGGHMRGRHDATHDSDRHRTRKSGAITAGAVLLATGVVANIVLRSVWLHDYVTPEGPEAFDFALMGHSIAYYGGLQVSSLMVASGLGALTYGAARPRNRQVFFSPSPFGLQVHGRF